MKRCLLIFVLLALAACALQAQYLNRIADGRSYATTDTTTVFDMPSGMVKLIIFLRDTNNVTIILDYRVDSGAPWKSYSAVADSTNSAGAYYQGFVLREAATDNIIGGVKGRVRITRKTTGNGTVAATKKWDGWLSDR